MKFHALEVYSSFVHRVRVQFYKPLILGNTGHLCEYGGETKMMCVIKIHAPCLVTCYISEIKILKYRKVVSSNTSRLEAHAGFFRLLSKGIFDSYVL